MAFDVVTYALLKGKISKIQEEIDSLAGGIKFKGSVPTREDLPTSPETGDSYIVEEENIQVVWDGNKWVEYGKSTNYTAGHGIEINNNVISALDNMIGKSFRTNATVGNLEAGSDIKSDMTLAEIMYKILYEDPQAVDIYHGATSVEPSGITGLIKDSVTHIDLPKYVVNITAGDISTGESQYPVVAVNKDYRLTSWIVADFPVGDLEFNSKRVGDYNIYWLKSKSYDVDLDGIYYQLKFVEVNG